MARVFGLMVFGAQAAEWDDDLFFYRTGVAVTLRMNGVVK